MIDQQDDIARPENEDIAVEIAADVGDDERVERHRELITQGTPIGDVGNL